MLEVAIWFPEWSDALMHASLAAEEQAEHRREILRFLRHCKQHHAAATVALVKAGRIRNVT